ncbi:ZrgA family zinc uptake protein [Ferrimonas marina]|uniref:DUF2796 domain-containing protein n=1 Tax=Ferrimonas marina TaxID=299255 RepID=A0A1M5RET3_9GAMM|nr:DUF2796 domain-containing protein [Ferrimonas marina]SHH24872.1 Protein of unknown function [Ferrimonas marina]
MKTQIALALAAAFALSACHPHDHDHDHDGHDHDHAGHEHAEHEHTKASGASDHAHDDHAGHGHDHDHSHDHGDEAHAHHHDHDHGDDHNHDHHDHDHDHDHEHGGHGAHVHGIGDLTLIQDGDAVQISLNIDTDALWGFERAPANDEEKEQVRRVLNQMTAGHRFFVLNGAADCNPTDVEITPPADLDTPGYVGHMELDAHWRWQCNQVEELNRVQVDFFKHYPSTHKMNVQRLTEKGSGGAVLDKSNATMSW